MSRTLAPVQAAYLLARATVDTLRAELAARLPAAPDSDDDAVLDAYEDMDTAIRIELGLCAAENALVAAEQSLVDWSSAAALKVATTDEARASVEICRTRGMKSWAQRPKLIDLAMRLSA